MPPRRGVFTILRFLKKLFLIIFGFCRPPFSTNFRKNLRQTFVGSLVLIGLAYPGREDLIPAGRGPRDLSHRVFRTTGEAVKNLAGVSPAVRIPFLIKFGYRPHVSRGGDPYKFM